MSERKRNSLGKFIKKEWATLICKTCQKQFKVFPCRANSAKFCSDKCSRIYHCGKKCAAWKGGIKINLQGYILLYMPEHPYSKEIYIREHRYIAECILGRFLNSKEIIHHINGIKTDNNPKNLYLFSSVGKHTSYHLNLKYNNIKPITESNLA